MAALWSVLALSGTLASEARRGSLEFVATTPLGKRRIALEKLAAHVTGMAIVVLVTAICTYVAGTVRRPCPATRSRGLGGVRVRPVDRRRRAGLGSVAFALAPFVGRGASAAIAGAVLARSATSPTATRTRYRPSRRREPHLVGLDRPSPAARQQFDWASLVPAASCAIVLFAVGVDAFARRDLGADVADPVAAHARVALIGLGGPFTRSLGERCRSRSGGGSASA